MSLNDFAAMSYSHISPFCCVVERRRLRNGALDPVPRTNSRRFPSGERLGDVPNVSKSMFSAPLRATGTTAMRRE